MSSLPHHTGLHSGKSVEDDGPVTSVNIVESVIDYSAADGKTETYAFTEADRSFSIGAQWDMSGWGRPHDSTGFGWALNGLSAAHREFLRRGGTTFFLGDGTLRYRGEQDLEWYYRSELSKGFYLTADVQQVHSPGYNADRGPARFYALRLHWEQ